MMSIFSNSHREVRRASTLSILMLLLFSGAMPLSAAEPADEQSFSGPPVKQLSDLEPYTGYAAADRIVGDWRRKAYLLNFEQLAVNYGQNVDFQLREKQIILTPQTEEFLCQQYIPVPRYQAGSRPELEKITAAAVKNCRTTQEKVLALMRYCRDLKKRAKVSAGGKGWKYGGTEEELIAKGEDLCETLGRLFVALCEIEGIPARIVMHNIGGHITAEAYIDGEWGYLDPRFGIYFLKPDGKLASLRELMQNPSLTENQPAAVKAEAAGPYSHDQRAQASREKFFNPQEVNGFEYYSLADAPSYAYNQVSSEDATLRGLFDLAPVYRALIQQVFYTNPQISDFFWQPGPLHPLPLNWRNDGFSSYFAMTPPFEPEEIDKNEIAPFADGPVKTLVWGTGPGSTFSHRTRVGEIFGYAVTDEEWKTMFRPGDKNVHDGISGLIERGIDPQAMIADLGHSHGLKVLSRLEMNHEYYLDKKEKNGGWMWHGFNGELVKKHPEYRVSDGNPNLDYRHPEVRQFKLAVLRELVQTGVDGIEVDLAVYPPHFAKPDPAIMTDFIRRVRAMLDEEGKKQGRRLALHVTVPQPDAVAQGMDWPTWLKEKLVDTIIPGTSVRGPRRYAFDLRIDEFVRTGHANGVKVFGYLDQSLRIFNRDPHPDGKQRYARGKRPEEFRAQVLNYMRSGVDGIQFAMAVNTNYARNKAMYDSLADPANVEFADKNYIVGPFTEFPTLSPNKSASPKFFTATTSTRLRIGDDIAAAADKGITPEATLVLNFRGLKPGEKVEAFINGGSVGVFSGDDPEEKNRVNGPIKPGSDADLMVPDWWKRGVHELKFPAEKLWLGENIIRVVYSASQPREKESLQVLWPEIQLRYPKNTASAK